MGVLGDNIKKYRLQKNLTQKQLAQKLCKSEHVVSNWETGTNKPDADTIELLCGILEIDANTLLGWESAEQMKRDAEDLADIIMKNPETKELLNAVKNLPEGDINLIINFVNRFAKEK